MDVLIWGSRALTPKHLKIVKQVSWHAQLASEPHLRDFLAAINASGPEERARSPRVDTAVMGETPRLINGDGPPSSTVPGAIGADKLALLACFGPAPLGWETTTPARVRWFRVEPKPGESWGAAAARRDIAMAEARPHRAYCIHTNLDASKGSIITARALERLGIGYWYVRVSASGKVESIERRAEAAREEEGA